MTSALSPETRRHVARALQIANDLKLPLELVTESFAILAKKRVGKSYTARRIAEQLFKAGLQIVVVDPKGDWWGIRSAANGKTPGLPILILGGEHGDVPLEPGSGELVAKLVVEDRVSVLIDLSHLRKGERARFMADFGETLYRLKAKEQFRTPMMLLIDEADAVAPQRPQHGEERMLGAIEDIVRRGGQRGIGCGLVTQRSAVLNKNVLTQTQLLVVLRTIAPQDLKAMDEWIDVHGTPEQRKLLMDSLSSLPKGDAWFWSPGWPTDEGIFKRVHVLPIETYDSGATPKAGEKRVEPKKRADIDIEAFKGQMAETIERAKATDPRELQKRIAELEAELKKVQASKAAKTKVEIREVPVLKEGQLKRIEALFGRGEKIGIDIRTGLAELAQVVKPAMSYAPPAPAPRPPARPPLVRTPPPSVNRPVVAPRSPAGDQQATGDVGLKKGAREMLRVIASSPTSLTRQEIGVHAVLGYQTGTFSDYLSSLRRAGYIIDEGNRISAVEGTVPHGYGHHPIKTAAELFAVWSQKLKLGARRMLQVLIESRAQMSREQLGEAAMLGHDTGTFSDYLSLLRRNGLVEDLGRNVAASAALFLSETAGA